MVVLRVFNVAQRQQSPLFLPEMFDSRDGYGSQAVANDVQAGASAKPAVESATVNGRGDGLPLPSFDNLWK